MPLIPILLSALGSFGPDIVKWIAGDKAGAAAQIAADKAKEIFGTDDPSGIDAAIKRDPNLALQYSMAMIAAKTESERIAADREKAARQAEVEQMKALLADVQSARGMAMSNSPIRWGSVIVSIMSVALAGLVAYMFMFPSPQASRLTESVVLMWVGAAINWVATVQNFWLGSSQGSQQKDASLADLKALLIRGRG